MAPPSFHVRPIQVETPTALDSSAPDSSAPDSSAPDSSAPDSSAPDSSAPSQAQLERYADLVQRSEEWLVARVLRYARQHGFSQHASPRRGDWIAAVSGLSAALTDTLRRSPDHLELRLDTDPSRDPVCSFGVLEARRHRARGVPLEMYFGLMKYFRRAYHDLCLSSTPPGMCVPVVDRYFDRIELGFISEWLHSSQAMRLQELQGRNRDLAVENARYNTLFETLSSPVLVTDEQGCVRRLNEAARRVLDLAEPGLTLDWLDRVMRETSAASGEVRHFELDLDGTHRADRFEGTLASLPDLTSDSAGFVVILYEVTERERARQDLLRARDELEDRVRERTAELRAANQRLRAEIAERERAEEEREQMRGQLLHAQKMEAIGTLAGGVAHDINNLVQIIMGSTDLLRVAGQLADDDLLHLDHIAHAADRAGSLVRQLLVFSRKQPMEPRPIDLNALVGDLLCMLQRLLGPDIEVQLQLESQPCAAMVDPGGIEQLLMNLVVNARDAMEGMGRLTIQTRPLDLGELDAPPLGVAEGRFIELVVGDTGTGIDADALDRIFEPFFTTKPSGLGTGLGLSVAYGIVQQHGGSISVDSRPGKGTTFHILLPAIGTTTASVADPTRKTLPRGQGQHVLVVEDKDGVRAVTTLLLTRHGYRATSVRDAQQALEAFAREPAAYDLLLSDIILPGKTGDELARELRDLRPHLPVLFMSGHAHLTGPRDLEHPLLPKPFSTAQLLEAVQDLVCT